MKYMDALRKYNEGSDKWCIPRKGSEDYLKIRSMMKKISSIQNSKSKDSSKEDIEAKNNRIRVLQAAIKRRLTAKKNDEKKNDEKEKTVRVLQAAIKRRLTAKKNDEKKNDEKEKTVRVLQAAIKRRLTAKKDAKSKSASASAASAASSASSASSASAAAYKTSSRVFSSDVYKNQKITNIQKFLRNKLIAKKNNLISRINTYKLVSERIAGLKEDECLVKKTFNGVAGYTIRDIINLEKTIGTPSKFGAIYLTNISNLLGIYTYPIAAKVMAGSGGNINEVKLMTKITNDLLLKKMTRHFLMIYGSCLCSGKIADKLKLVSINELADGDLKTLVHTREVVEDSELMYNLLFQTFISIATFQNIVGHLHRDPHYGNFLFQTNNDKGYYHYVFNGTDYYLKACKYNIIIFDFGMSRPIIKYKDTALVGLMNSENRAIAFDYINIIYSFFNSKLGGHVKFPNLPKEPANRDIFYIAKSLDDYVKEDIAANPKIKNYENAFFDTIINEVFLKYTPKGMFVTTRPPNVINSTPFYISTNAATNAKPKAAAKAKAKPKVQGSPVHHDSSTQANIVAAVKNKLAEYKKFVKDMRPKVKSNFPNLNPKQTNKKIDELYKTFIRRRDGLTSLESVSIPDK